MLNKPFPINFINSLLYYLVFRWLCFPACLRYLHYPGASGVFDVPPVLHTRTPPYEELYYTVSCRSELMSTVAELLLLDEDAVFRSFDEVRPLRAFRNQAKIDRAKCLYANGSTPYTDLLNCAQGCSFKWAQLIHSLM